MSAEEQQAIKDKLLGLIQEHLKEDAKFTEIDTKEIAKTV